MTDRQDSEEPVWRREAEGLVCGFSNGLGSGAVAGCRNQVGERGVDPLAIRRTVLEIDGAEMTPLPGELYDEVRRIHEAADHILVHCPIWTENGRSRLSMEVRLVPDTDMPEYSNTWVERLCDRDGADVLTALTAPALPRQMNTPTDEPTGVGGDSRINRGAFVGGGYGMLIGQLTMGMERAVGEPIANLDRLNDGQAAIAVLEWAFMEAYGDGFPAVYDRGNADLDTRLVDAARRVGAPRWAELFARARDLIPEEVRRDPIARASFLIAHILEADPDEEPVGPHDALDDEFYDLERSGDVIWEHMIRYIEANPGEFFR